MSKHLTHKFRGPFHWDGHEPEPQSYRPCTQWGQEPCVRPRCDCQPTPEPEGWDIDGLGR